MRKLKYFIFISVVMSVLFYNTSCKDDFATVNTDPATITDGNPSFLFAQAILEFNPQDYLYWFYNASEIFQWVQTGVSTGGVTSTLADGAPAQNFKSLDVLRYANELEYVRSLMPEDESAKYAQYSAALDVLSIYMGIYDTDFTGDIAYTEAARAAHGGTLTPKFDRVQDLYNLWLENLDNDIQVLTTANDQVFLGTQDLIYAGNTDNWAKLANSLKLKIAARLINRDRSKALQIAQQVAGSPIGVISNQSEDFLFNKATSSNTNNDYVYNWNNAVLQTVGGSITMIDFMVENRDPRVRFIFQKNHWNSKVVQLFFDAGREDDVPHFIMDNIEYVIETDGTYRFTGWSGLGEPWVRYYGLPLDFNAGQQAGQFGDWFNYTIRSRYDENHIYRPYSMFQTEMLYGRIDFSYPIVPGDPAIRDTEDVPWWGIYMTSAEVNLYLAEFALLGASLPESAETYYNRALQASVRNYDRLAANNKIPYYGTTYNYDQYEEAIDLLPGEIEEMMSSSDYSLTGDVASDIEKVYLQQIVHFSLQPIDQYTTARRSGVPVIGSDLFPRTTYSQVPVSSIPRRMALNQPSPTDLMYEILTKSYQDQGLSVGSGTILNSERIWQDVGSPQWGEGPNL